MRSGRKADGGYYLCYPTRPPSTHPHLECSSPFLPAPIMVVRQLPPSLTPPPFPPSRPHTWNASMAGATVQIMVVRQLPPRLSSRIRVSLLSRYGMCERSPRAVSAPMTLPGRGGGEMTECVDAQCVQ